MKVRDNRKVWRTDDDLMVNSEIITVELSENGTCFINTSTGYSVIFEDSEMKQVLAQKIKREVLKRMKGGKGNAD